MRVALTIAAFILSLLCTAALLALRGIGGRFGITLHTLPAGAIHALAETLNLYLPPDGSVVRSAHGPPFLTPLGVIFVYAVPAVLLFVVARTSVRR